MVKLSRIFRDYTESGAFHTLVGVQSAVGGHVFLTKGGALVCILRVDGVDAECLDAGEIDHVTRRFEGALRTLDERYRVYQYVLKRRQVQRPGRKHGNPVLEQAIADRSAYLQTKDLYSVELYWAVVYEGWRPTSAVRADLRSMLRAPWAALRSVLSAPARIAGLETSLSQAADTLTNKVKRLAAELGDVAGVELLDKHQAFRFLRRLVNFAPEKADGQELEYDDFVDFQTCSSELECHRDHLRLDDHFVQVLTVKQPPARTTANMLGRLLDVASELIVVSEWKRAPNAAMRGRISGMRRHFHNSRASMANYLSTGPPAQGEVLIDHGADAMVGDLGHCWEEMELNGRSFGEWSLSIVVYDRDRQQLARSVAEVYKVCAAADFALTEERYNILNAYLATLPGNHPFNLRRLWLSDANAADLGLLFAPYPGEPVNQTLGGEHLAVFETSGGTPYLFNLHHHDVAHALLFGATGSGKSFLTNFLLTHLQKYAPRTYVFDLGGSYEHLTKQMAGAYATMNLENQSVAVNPFCLPPTPENRRFLLAFVRVLAESGGYQVTTQDERDLHEQIENLYSVEPAQRRLLTLANILNRNLREQLRPWVAGGPYAALFDNVEDALSFARFQTFDFEGMDKLPRVLEPLLFYVLHRASAAIYDPNLAATFKVFVMDEAWRFLRHPAIRSYIEEAFKTWRKKNAAMILVTQSSDDLLRSEILPVAVESCPTKLFLANPGADIAAYRETFHLNETEARLIANLVPKQQILIKRPNRSKLVQLNVDPKHYWLYTNSPLDNQTKRQAFDQHGLDGGLAYLARSQPS